MNQLPESNDPLQRKIASLAEQIEAEPTFVAHLERRVRQTRQTSNSASRWRRLQIAFAQLQWRYRVAFALSLVLLCAVPVMAGFDLLQYFVPIETAQYPTVYPPSANPITRSTRVPTVVQSRDELTQKVGFSILTPTYLPANCPLLQYAFDEPARAAFLSYVCVDILLQRQLPDWRSNPLRQPVGPDAVQTMSLNGAPAYYIEGIWQFADPRATPIWSPSGARRLVFARGDLLIDVIAAEDMLPRGAPLMSKEELVRIAEGLR